MCKVSHLVYCVCSAWLRTPCGGPPTPGPGTASGLTAPTGTTLPSSRKGEQRNLSLLHWHSMGQGHEIFDPFLLLLKKPGFSFHTSTVSCFLFLHFYLTIQHCLPLIDRLREQAYNWVSKGQRLHVTGRIIYGEVGGLFQCFGSIFIVSGSGQKSEYGSRTGSRRPLNPDSDPKNRFFEL